MSSVELTHEAEIMLRKTGFPNEFMEAISTDWTYVQLVKEQYQKKDILGKLPDAIIPIASSKFSNQDFIKADNILSCFGIIPEEFWHYLARNYDFARRLIFALFTNNEKFIIEVDTKKIINTELPLLLPKEANCHEKIRSIFSPIKEERYEKEVFVFQNRKPMKIYEVFSLIENFNCTTTNPFENIAMLNKKPEILEKGDIIVIDKEIEEERDKNYKYNLALGRDENKNPIVYLLEDYKEYYQIMYGSRKLPIGTQFVASLRKI